jgi:hypothetical protein
MDYNEISKILIPLYRRHNDILIGLSEDYPEVVDDGLVVMINLENKKIIGQPSSGQRIVKHGYWDVIEKDERQQVMKLLDESLEGSVLNEIIDLLINPPKDSIQSLLWKPERFKKNE